MSDVVLLNTQNMFKLKKKKFFQIDFIIFQPKHMLLVLKMYVKIEEKENIYNFYNIFNFPM